MSKLNALITVLKGLWVGGTMTVPGVSGGSMAMILGIYDKLISSISNFFKQPKKSIIFLATFLIGAGAGMVLFSKYILMLIENYPMPTRYFFLGAVVGGAPMIFRASKTKKVSWKTFLYLVIGVVCVLLIAQLPEGLFAPQEKLTFGGVILQLVGGLIVAIGLVLPGISVSQMLLMMGLYEFIMQSVSTLNVLPLIPLAIGVVGGIFLTTKLLENFMQNYPQATYLIVFGFLIGSVPELFPGFPTGWQIPLSILTAALGFLGVYYITKKEAQREAKEEQKTAE